MNAEPRDAAQRASARQASLDDLTPLIETTFVVLDLETTGLSPGRDRITEIGAVRARGGEVLAELRTFVHPGVPIPPGVTAITGITDADVADAPDVASALPITIDFIGDAVLVAHNARFDLGFLRAAASRLGMPPIRPRVIDTAVLARRLIRDEVRDLRLATLARHLRAPGEPDHRALNDARATLHVLHALIERASGLGATSIEDLEQLCGPTGDRSHRRIALIAEAPPSPGVYRFLASDGTVLYVGKASDLRRRLRSYFGNDTRRRTADLIAATDRIDWTVLPTDLEAAVREVRELQSTRPRYNRRSVRPDPGLTVALTREAFPRLAIIRGAPKEESEGLGPVPRSIAERVVEGIESVIPLRPCRPRLRSAQDNPACILKDLHRCDAVCDGTQTPEGYASVVDQARRAMQDPTPILDALWERMIGLAAEGDFEAATECREQLAAVVRAADARRHTDMLRGTRVVLERRTQRADAPGSPPEMEVILLHDGVLVGSWRGDASSVPEREGDVVTTDGPPSPSREESDLVRRWLMDDGVVARSVEGVLASPIAGGARLAQARAELNAAERSSRSDDVSLSRLKVRARA